MRERHMCLSDRGEPVRDRMRGPCLRPRPLRQLRDLLPEWRNVLGRRVRLPDGSIERVRRSVCGYPERSRKLRRMWQRMRRRLFVSRGSLHAVRELRDGCHVLRHVPQRRVGPEKLRRVWRRLSERRELRRRGVFVPVGRPDDVPDDDERDVCRHIDG